MMIAAAAAFTSYMIGAIPFSYLAGKLAKGIDLREHGSGNLGASNTFRILGPAVAIPVLILDITKGFLPVFFAGRLMIEGAPDPLTLSIVAMFFAILGHLFSPYVRFSGGKGIATSAGAFLALAPWAFLGAFVVFAIVFASARIVSLASLSAAVILPVFVFLLTRTGVAHSHWSVLAVSITIMIIVIIKHRSNIKRLVAGTEPRLARKKG